MIGAADGFSCSRCYSFCILTLPRWKLSAGFTVWGKKKFPPLCRPLLISSAGTFSITRHFVIAMIFPSRPNVVSCSELPSQRRYKLILSSDFDTIHTEKPNNTQGGKKRREFKKQTQTWLTEHTP